MKDYDPNDTYVVKGKEVDVMEDDPSVPFYPPDRRCVACVENHEFGRREKSILDYIPFVNRRRGQLHEMLTTPHGSVPSLCIRMYHGVEEIQRTSTIHVSPKDWSEEGSVYFKEISKVTVERRPHSKLRIEIRDAHGSLGQVELGHITFTEDRIEHEFERSRKKNKEASNTPRSNRTVYGHEAMFSESTAIATRQASEMLLLETGSYSSRTEEQSHCQLMWDLGFAPHRLSDGGAIWLGFADLDDGRASNADCFACI
mmetsp:Transcript_86187/g.191980  ORF Transcript_86187/g.191980 Transcript_86187/m.191980 type:complete len:257 (+) Transcript_86187:2-772(+)